MGETFIVLGETILVLGETICAKLVMGETRYNPAPVSQRSWVQIPYTSEIFSSLIFTTAQVLFITAKIAFIFTSLSAVHMDDFRTYSQLFKN